MTTRRPAVLMATALAAALTLTACGSSSTSGSSTTSAAATSAATAPVSNSSATSGAVTGAGSSSAPALPTLADGSGAGKKIVYVPGLTGVPFYSSVSCGAAAEAQRLGADFTTQGDPTFAVDKQTAIINSLVANKPDAIMVSITDPKAMIVPLQEAKDAGIQIIGIDGDLIDESIMATNIQSDNIEGGALAADRLGEVMGGKGSVVIIDNATGSLIADARVKGFTDELAAKYPGITNLGVQYSANSTDKAASITSASIANNPDITGIFGVETNNTQGAITGIQESGRTGEVHLVGYDTSDPIIKATQNKQVDGLVVQFPYGEGALGVQSAVTLLNGGTVPRLQNTPFMMVTPENLDSPEAQKFIYKVDC